MKHHLITGAASGFGFGLARTLLARGDSVMACDINTAPMEQLRAIATAPAQLNIRQLDVRDPAQWEQTMQAAVQLWPRIDTVMNVAGVLRPDFIADIRLDDINLTFDVNTKSAIFGTQAAFRAMRNQADENGRGHIINLASMAGIAPLPGMSIYSASKFALRGYSLSIAQELKQHSISITVVCPSGADTPLVEPYKHKNQAALIFIAPLLTTEEVVRAVVDRALVKRPMEITLPRARGLLAKAAGSFPILAQRLAASMTRTGLRNQAKMK
ncbi:MAG TPA: SDR family oxidoreductase [Candidatus Angelobacter sp.]|jgi:3-oxoacyl-[acyl-carrier protein] reductase|nr:SDR family oxidoreductase [Candidatus Angelobacter sp.]